MRLPEEWHEEFIVTGPLWFIGPSDGPSNYLEKVQTTLDFELTTVNGLQYNSTPIFTDSDLAFRFIQLHEIVNQTPFTLQTLDAVELFVIDLMHAGTKYVSIDPGEVHYGRQYSIERIVDAMRNNCN